MNIRETVLKYLKNKENGATREEIQTDTGYTNGSLKNALAQLTSNNWAVESSGTYRITLDGVAALANPINLTFGATVPKVKKRENIIDQIFDWDDIQADNMCRQVLGVQISDEPWIELLAPLVIIYLKAKGIEFPVVTGAVAENVTDSALNTIYNDFMDKLIDLIA